MPIIKNLKQHKIVLDTHVWIWTMAGQSILTEEFCKAFDHALKIDSVLISPISIWEVSMLVEKKRIYLDMDTQEWIDQSLEISGLRLSPITPKIAVQSTRLPGLNHSATADRLLIATAHEENAVLVTCDQKILKYGEDKFVSVHDPSYNNSCSKK